MTTRLTEPNVLVGNQEPRPFIGRILEGRYRIEKEIGSGGMGSVYLATALDLGRPVAIKTFDPGLVQDPGDARARFMREGKALALVRHPNVVKVHVLAEDPETRNPYMVMDFVPGTSLEQYIRNGPVTVSIPWTGGVQNQLHALAFPTAFRLIRIVAEAVRAIHRNGILHRDLKTANVQIVPPGPENAEDYPVVIDFGLAKSEIAPTMPVMEEGSDGRTLFDVKHTVAGQFFGTVHYAHPQQFGNQRTTDVNDRFVDAYALACMLYEGLGGIAPYEDHPLIRDARVQDANQLLTLWKYAHHIRIPFTPISCLRPDLDAGLRERLDQFFAEAFNRDPGRGFRTVDAFLQALDACTDATTSAVPLSARPTPPPEPRDTPPPAEPSRGHFIMGGAAFALTLLVVAALWGLNRWQARPSVPREERISVAALPRISVAVNPVPPDVTAAVPAAPADASEEGEDAAAFVADGSVADAAVSTDASARPRPRSRSRPPRPCRSRFDPETGTLIPCF